VNSQDFIALFRGYWPQAKNVAAPKQQELWEDVIDGIPDATIAYGLKRYARSARYPPTALEFERHLWPIMDAWAREHPERHEAHTWNRRMKFMHEAAQDEHPEPIIHECEGCGIGIRHDPGPPLRRYPDDGGLVFKQDESGEWMALRCPLCRGPGHLRPWPVIRGRSSLIARYAKPIAVPIPPSDQWESGEWKARTQTDGQGLWEALEIERTLSPTNPHFVAYFAWERAAIARSRTRVDARLAELEQEIRADERQGRADRAAAHAAAREAISAQSRNEESAMPDPTQVGLAIEDVLPPPPNATDGRGDDEPPF